MASEEGGIGAKTYGKIGLAFLVAGGLLFGIPSVAGSASGDIVWLGLFGLLFGGLGLVVGFQQYKKAQLIRNTPTSKVRSLAVGAAEVEGQARPVDETITSPLTRKEAVVYELEVRQRKRDDDGGTSWKTVFEARDEVPFAMDDGTGEVLVEPEDAELQIALEAKETVREHHDPPENLAEWAEERGYLDGSALEGSDPEEGGEDGGGLSEKISGFAKGQAVERVKRYTTKPVDQRTIYKERLLEPGESAYVFGAAHRREGADSTENVDNLVLREHEGTDTFILSDEEQAGLAEDYLVKAAVGLALGLVGIPYGVVGLGSYLGVI